MNQTKKIIFVFLVITLVSSVSVSAILMGTGKVNFAFATSKKRSGNSSGGGGRDDKGSPDSSPSSDKGGGGSTDNGEGGTDNSNGGGSSGDTSNTSMPPPATEGNTPSATEETTPPPTAEENTGASPPPPAAENQQQTTCPDGLTPDENGKCPPTTTLAPNQPPAQNGHILVMPNGDGTCPAGSHKFPGSQVCEKDTIPPAPQQGGTTGTTNPASNLPPLTPQQQYEECLKGIGGGIPGNCKPPITTEQNTALLQTLTQKTCPPLPIDANGRCPGVDMRGGGLGLPPVPPPPPDLSKPILLPTTLPNPLLGCVSGTKIPTSHGDRCLPSGVKCPSGSVRNGDLCMPEEVALLPDGRCRGIYDPTTNKCYHDSDHAPPCPGKPGQDTTDAGRGHDVFGICRHPQTGLPLAVYPQNTDGTCSLGGGVHIASSSFVCFVESDGNSRDIDGSCQSGYLAVDNSCKLKIHDPLPNGACPAGYHSIPAPTAPVPLNHVCKHDLLKLTSDDVTSEFVGGYCPVGYRHVSSASSGSYKCFRNS